MLEQLTVATPGLSSDHVAMSEYFDIINTVCSVLCTCKTKH